MILKISFNLALSRIYKISKVLKAFLKKELKFYPYYWIIVLNIELVLLPLEVNLLTKKAGYKKDFIITLGISIIKVIVILVIKIVAFYIKLTIVKI